MHLTSLMRVTSLFVLSFVAQHSASAAVTYQQIALSGELAAGDPGFAVYDTLLRPVINDASDVAFLSHLADGPGPPVPNDSNVALFGPTAGAGSSLGIVARENLPAPDTSDDSFYSGLFAPTLNNSGDYAFPATLRTGTGIAVTSNNNDVYFGPTAGAGSPMGVIAREDAPAGTADNAEFDDFLYQTLNNSGESAFMTRLRTSVGGEPVTADNNDALVFAANGLLLWMARENEPAPGAEDGALFGTFSGLALNDSGDIASRAWLRSSTETPLSNENDQAILAPVAGPGSSLELLYRKGATAPGDVDGAVIDEFFGDVALNNHSDLAFSAFLETGTGGAVADEEDVVLYGPTSGPGSELGVRLREGDPVPGLPGILFSNPSDGPVFHDVALNDRGVLAFVAQLAESDGSFLPLESDLGLFAQLGDVVLPVVMEGEQFPVTLPDGITEELRTINSIEFLSGGLNNQGVLAFGLEFTDGSQGIFTAHVGNAIPEPASIGLFTVATVSILISRRRRS